MMIVQSTPIILKQRNQPHRECLYAWYPEAVTPTVQEPRDIYIHKGIDKDLIRQPTPNREAIDLNVFQRYQQSMTTSERDFQSTETLDEALRTPWALHYEIQRRAATPNFSCNSTQVSTTEEVPRRLKSAPPMRSLPSTTVLTIPEPRFVTPIIPVVTETVIQVRPKTRASSAKARLNTTYPSVNEDLKERQHREIKSAQGVRTPDLVEDQPRAIIQVLNDTMPYQEPAPTPLPVSPAYIYQKPPSRSSSAQASSTPLIIKALRSTAEINPIPLNPHYIHRPGVISVKNSEKKAVVRESSAPRKSSRHHRRHHHRHEKSNEPLLALTPVSRSIKMPFELDGIKLIYDRTLTIDDPSLNVTRYFIEGSLYVIKDQRFNVFENIDPTMIEKFNQTSSSLPARPKYYQTIPVEKFQIPKPAADVHYNASETYFYNTIPKRVHRYVIDPNFISENLNVNKMSLSKRPITPAVAHSSLNDFYRRQNTPPTLYT